ncbi:MAG: tetratricopeptide repeat protein [Planctomycetota bacterium]
MPSERENRQVVEKGIEHMENGEDDRAIECFTEAIRLNPECARAYHLRGQIYSKAGKWAKAERDVAKARRVEARQT